MSRQICNFWSLLVGSWVLFDHFDPPLDPWGAPKWVKNCSISKMDATIAFSHMKLHVWANLQLLVAICREMGTF